MLRRFPNSLSWRLLAVLAAWVTLALLITGLLISTVFRSNAERGFEDLLQAHAYNLIGAIEVKGNTLVASPDFGDPRFSTPLSGWYWSVATAQAPQKPLIHSTSISGDDIDVPTTTSQPFDDTFRRGYAVVDSGIQSQRFETQLFLGDSTETLYQVLVAGNRAQLDASIEAFTRRLWLFFALFGVGTIGVVFLAIRVGLRPLRRARDELVDIRAGEQDRLKETYPSEILPLAHEINALIEANGSVMERARTQVGNLAHALKTPLAVIKNESGGKGNAKAWKTVAGQADLMESQVRSYLDRARISAQRETAIARTSFQPVADQLVSVMRKLNPHVTYAFDAADEDVVLRIEEQDLQEILGNVLENASRFAKSTVRLTPDVSQSAGRAAIAVEDDGPGLTEEECALAIKRGQRLDESTRGSGLGLSIVNDIAREYRGDLRLDRSDLGGLRATISLPFVTIAAKTQAAPT